MPDLLEAEKRGGLGILFLLGARLLLWPSPVLELQLLAVFWLCHVCGRTFIAWGVFRHFKPGAVRKLLEGAARKAPANHAGQLLPL